MSTETDQELTTPQVRMKKNGDLIQRIDGAEVVVAKYSQATGYVEFQTKEFSETLYNQVVARIGTTNKGKEQSGNVIKAFGVKGTERVDLKSVPKRPSMKGPLGDSSEEVVQWYLDHNLPEAIIRYRIYTDAKGKPRRANVRRKYDILTDNRGLDVSDLREVADGPKTFSKSPISISKEMDEFKNQIIAGRATPLTFTPEEVWPAASFDTELENSTGGDDE